MIGKLRQCLNIAKFARIRYQWQELKDVKSVYAGLHVDKRTILPLILFIPIAIFFYLVINIFILFAVILKPHPSIPGNCMFYDFWDKCGLENSFGTHVRLDVISKWLVLLYPEQNFDIASRVNQLHKNRAASRRPGLHIRYMDAVDNIVLDLRLYLPG